MFLFPFHSSSESKIQAIERKLKLMDGAGPDFAMSSNPTAPPGSSKLSRVNAAPPVTDTRKPYFRKDPRR